MILRVLYLVSLDLDHFLEVLLHPLTQLLEAVDDDILHPLYLDGGLKGLK